MNKINQYIKWRWGSAISNYFKIVWRFVLYFSHLFAISLLLRTIFWPWKRDSEISQNQGFNLQAWFQKLLFNFFSRIIGFVLKLFAIFIFLIIEFIWIVLSILFFPVWILLPLSVLILVSFVPQLIINVFQSNSQTIDLLGLELGGSIVGTLHLLGVVLLILFLIVWEIKIYNFHKFENSLSPKINNPKINDLWFQSVAAHLLIDVQELKEIWGTDKIKTVCRNSHLDEKEFEKLVNWELTNQIDIYNRRCWWTWGNLFTRKPLTEDWVYGWTFTLSQFSQDLRPRIFSLQEPINISELEVLKNVLSEGDGVNAVLIGETGVGRKRLVTELATSIAHRTVPANLLGKKVLEFNIDTLLAATNDESTKIFYLEKALLEAASAGNVILYVPTLHTYLEAKTNEKQIGTVDISAVLTNFLENTNIQLITVATQKEINNLLDIHPNLGKYFKIINLKEPQKENILTALREKSYFLEHKFSKLITYAAIKRTYEISDRYLQDQSMPKRANEFLEEAMNFLNDAGQEKGVIREKDIETFATKKIGTPIGSLGEDEKDKLLHLEDELHEKIIGQEPAIKAIASALRRRRLDLSNSQRPAGCFLFLGPTGVGKTYTAESLAGIYYRGDAKMARLDMSEYQGEDALIKLLGDSSGNIEGYFHKILSGNPFNLVLFDELEKASRNVHQLLLQIMEEGMAKTGTGQKLNFRETLIIATSNAESSYIQKSFSENNSYPNIQRTCLEKIQEKGIFSPELLNRFDDIIIFHPLTTVDMIQISSLALKDLKKRLESQDILVSFDLDFMKRLAVLGYHDVFGARELRRVVQTFIEDSIAKDLLSGKIEKRKEFKLPIEYLDNIKVQ